MERKMDEQDILREVGIHRDAYRGSWVYELSGTVSNGEVVLAIYYEVSEKDISADIKHCVISHTAALQSTICSRP